jgi:hypothetical protein
MATLCAWGIALAASLLGPAPPVAPWKTVAQANLTTGTLVFPNRELSVTVSLSNREAPIGAYALELCGSAQALIYNGTDNLQDGMLVTSSVRLEEDCLVLRVAGAGSADPAEGGLFRARFTLPRLVTVPEIRFLLRGNREVTDGVLLLDDGSGTRVRLMCDSLAVESLPVTTSPQPAPAPTPLPEPLPVTSAAQAAAQVVRLDAASYDANHNLDTVIDCADVVARVAE